MSIKTKIADIALKARNFVEILDNIRRQNRILTVTDKPFKSASDNGSYPELALRAALNPQIFSIFRRHHKYTPILEHVSKKQGEKYLQIIQQEYKLESSYILELLSPLQYIGQPKLCRIEGLAEPVSTTALRYLKVALDIKAFKGESLGHVVEIGCGYGGQAIILDRICRIESYTFIDLWQVNMLIKRFVETSSFSSKYCVSTAREIGRQRNSWDLVISNYAFSELPMELQENYMSEIIGCSQHGYMIMNSGEEGGFNEVENMSMKDLKAAIPSCTFLEERPLTNPRNYIIIW